MITAHAGDGHALCLGYLATPWDHCALLSLAGPAEAVKAVFAALLTRREVRLTRGPHVLRRLVVLPPEGFHALIRRLPAGPVHGILYPETALVRRQGTAFTLLLPQDQADRAPERCFAHLDARTELPLHPSWAGWLWKTFGHEGWLWPLEGEGDWLGWEVSWEEETLHHRLEEALREGHLSIPTPTPTGL